ncbi:hypothetical protein E2542_SST05040 [Spatholobus suberectus]|nr:hypothetical protein E2542_SST05040 [Spatholobus suberectus]
MGNGSPKANPAKATSKEEEDYCGTSLQSPRSSQYNYDAHTCISREHQDYYPRVEQRHLLIERQIKLKPDEFQIFKLSYRERSGRSWAYILLWSISRWCKNSIAMLDKLAQLHPPLPIMLGGWKSSVMLTPSTPSWELLSQGPIWSTDNANIHTRRILGHNIMGTRTMWKGEVEMMMLMKMMTMRKRSQSDEDDDEESNEEEED